MPNDTICLPPRLGAAGIDRPVRAGGAAMRRVARHAAQETR
jgi:hypothetical protein